MIFLDDLCEQDTSRGVTKATDKSLKLRVHPDVISLAHGIVHSDKIEAIASHVFLPSDRTWLEWDDHGSKSGFHFHGTDGSVKRGNGWYAWRLKEDKEAFIVMFRYDLEAFTMEPFEEQIGSMDQKGRDWILDGLRIFKSTIVAILAVINSPKVARVDEIDISRLNKQRVKRDRMPYNQHSEVRLNVDRASVLPSREDGDQGSGSGKCLHFVRTHLRFVPTQGGFTLVNPHWRGDPALGTKDKPRYRADRADSKWLD